MKKLSVRYLFNIVIAFCTIFVFNMKNFCTNTMRKSVTIVFPKEDISISLLSNSQFLVNGIFETKTLKREYASSAHENVCATEVLTDTNDKEKYCHENQLSNSNSECCINGFRIKCFLSRINSNDYYVIIYNAKNSELDYSGLYSMIREKIQLRCCYSINDSIKVLAMNDPRLCKHSFKSFDVMQYHLGNDKLIPCAIEEVFGSKDNVEIIENSEKYEYRDSKCNANNALDFANNGSSDKDTVSSANSNNSSHDNIQYSNGFSSSYNAPVSTTCQKDDTLQLQSNKNPQNQTTTMI